MLKRFGKTKKLTVTTEDQSLKEAASGVVNQFTKFFIPLAGLIDVPKERKRIEAKIAQQSNLVEGIEIRLANEAFVAKAPAEVIEKDREKLIAYKAEIKELKNILESLS